MQCRTTVRRLSALLADAGAVVVRAEGDCDPAHAAGAGVKDIRAGPTAPGFLTPGLTATLDAKFGLRLISTPDQTLAETLGA